MRPAFAGMMGCVAFLVALANTEALQAVATYSTGRVARRDLPWAGNGTCQAPVYHSGSDTTSVQCLGPRHVLEPGQTIDVLMLLENPYPKDRTVVVERQTAQLVDDNMRPVPLTEVYLHHYVSSYLFLLGNGAEARGSFTRKPLPEPYGLVVNGSFIGDPRQRVTNIQLINTVGLPIEEAKPCLECWCQHSPPQPNNSFTAARLQGHPEPSTDAGDPTFANERPDSHTGSLFCCHQCPSTRADAGPVGYHLQYTVAYRDVKQDTKVNRTDLIGFDVVGGKFEYQIPDALGPNSTHVKAYDTVFDHTCPQKSPMDIVRCTGHQHFGGQCVELINLDKNETICRTCPTFGDQPGVPGNESGYVVSIPDDDLVPPYTIAPGTRVQIQSKYDASVPRFGVMGLLTTWVAGLPEPCYKPPVNNSNSVLQSVSEQDTPVHLHTGFPLGGSEEATEA